MKNAKGFLRLVALSSVAACMERAASTPEAGLSSSVVLPVPQRPIDAVDLLFAIDNSGSMRDNQLNLARNFGPLLDPLIAPPLDPGTGRPRHPPVRSLHLGVISTDLGTPGSMVPSCADSDVGDDGLLNPVRNGAATRSHPPWTTAPPNVRPARCEHRADQYPSFLDFDVVRTDPEAFREDFVCNAYLSVGGCGLEQPLEAVYRALVVHGAGAGRGPNAGFVRDDAVLAIVVVTDEEDGSVRDCRYAEPGDPDGICREGGRGSALGVFDSTDPRWASEDLNLRFYTYAPGGPQDPTWPLDRYIDPTNPRRGYLSVKPSPELVIFSAITGVPLSLPQRPGTRDPDDPANVDWEALLGRRPDGADGLTAMSEEGPISMRHAHRDAHCTTRVVPACRREGTPWDPDACDTTRQYFAWPSRRVAEVARRFASFGNGTVSSICRRDYADALRRVVERIQRRLPGRCLPRVLETLPRAPRPGEPVRVNCVVRESLPREVSAAAWCTPQRGRRPDTRDAHGRETCLIEQLPVVPGQRPLSGEGFFYDTSDREVCPQRISFTDNAALAPGATGTIECVQSND